MIEAVGGKSLSHADPTEPRIVGPVGPINKASHPTRTFPILYPTMPHNY